MIQYFKFIKDDIPVGVFKQDNKEDYLYELANYIWEHRLGVCSVYKINKKEYENLRMIQELDK